MKICILLGTRPEIIKMAPVIRACIKKKLDFIVVHSGQHYSYNMDRVFFEELVLPEPNYNLEVGSMPGYAQTAAIIEKFGHVLEIEKPDVVLVEGDTNTVLAGALAAKKLNIKVGHVEAGLRSYDERMPEEWNRILTDHCSDFLFAPTKLQKRILKKEGIKKERIFVTGNTIVDSVLQNIELADTEILKKLDIKKDRYILSTIHRQESVDLKETLAEMLKAFQLIYENFHLPIILPIHPRTKANIEEFRLSVPEGVRIIEPLGFLEFLKLESDAKLIITDSGGIQEESCILRVPCVTMRKSTERPETVEVGANVVAGTEPDKVLDASKKMLASSRSWDNPLGDGNSAKRIIKIITK